MLYCPKHDQLWDCWIVPSGDKLYMYYLSITDGKPLFNSISLAISKDGVHFTEYGPVLRGDDNDQGWGTGMVQKIGDRYIMNYSITKDNEQIVHFAESRDLLNWTKLDNVCRADGVNYMRDPAICTDFRARWDSLGVIDALEDTAPPYYGFITATAQETPLANRTGALGFLTSDDGVNWKCLPNAFEDCVTFPHFEVPEHFEINGRHYVTFCCSSYLGFNFYKHARYTVGGTFYVVADNALGKYRLPPDGECMIQGTSDYYSVSLVSVGRPLRLNGQLLYYHIWGSNGGNGWFGTIKRLVEAAPYRLALEYSDINDALFGRELNYTLGKTHCQPGVKNAVSVEATGNKITLSTLGTPNAIYLDGIDGVEKTATPTELYDGRIITADLSLEGGEAGFYFELEDGQKIAISFNRERGCVEFGNLINGWATCTPFRGLVSQPFNVGQHSSVKIFARRWFIEVYVNGRYATSLRTDSLILPNRAGIFANGENCVIDNLKIIEMK